LVELLDLLISFGRSRRSDSGFHLPAGQVFIPQRPWFFVNSTRRIALDVFIDRWNRLVRLLTKISTRPLRRFWDAFAWLYESVPHRI
jgi:hypothetical protein